MTACEQVIDQTNTVEHIIKITSEISSLQIHFLDLMIYAKEVQMHTELYTNPQIDTCILTIIQNIQPEEIHLFTVFSNR